MTGRGLRAGCTDAARRTAGEADFKVEVTHAIRTDTKEKGGKACYLEGTVEFVTRGIACI
jgi:hypothetical protein